MKRTWTHPAHDHFRQLLAAVTILGLCLLPVHAAVSADALADLYANHQWFELRDAVPSAADAPARYRAAVACGFHTATCEREGADDARGRRTSGPGVPNSGNT